MRFTYFYRKMVKLFANSGDPDQTPHSAASDLGLHCLLMSLLQVSRLQWVKIMSHSITPDRRSIKYFPHFSTKPYVVGTH